MKVLLTGANGLLGSYFLRILLDKGYSVRATKRSNSDLSLIQDIADKVDWFEGDMCDYLAMEKVMESCDMVVHSAAVVSYEKKDKENMIRINVSGTRNLIDIALEKKVKKFIHVSSIAAVGRPKAIFNLNEETKWEESPNNSTYAKSKYLSELEVWRGIAEGLDAVILNPSYILGPGDMSRSSTQIFRYIKEKSRFYTDGNLNFVDVRDVAKALELVIDQDKSGERFIICGGTIKFKDLFTKAAQRWNLEVPKYRISRTVSEIVWRIEAVRTFIFGGKPIISKDASNSANSQYTLSNEKSRQKLNMEYRSIDETLDWVCAELN